MRKRHRTRRARSLFLERAVVDPRLMPQLRQAQPTINEMPAPTKWLPLVTSLFPRVLERGDRARVDARSPLPFGLEARCRGGHAWGKAPPLPETTLSSA